MTGFYEPWLVVLSIVVAAIASYTALDLARRVNTARGPMASAWLLGGACSMGTGIWAMHFVGMLAFSLPIPMAYKVPETLLSMLIAVVVSAFALYVVSRPKLGLGHLLGGAVLMGLGISAMHYTGMAAMDVMPAIQYDPWRVLMSVGVAILAALAALTIALKLPRYEERIARPAQMLSSLLMGLAITGMHYTAMSAARFAPGTVCLSGTAVNNDWMAGLIALISLTILGVTILLSVFDGHIARRTGALTAVLDQAKESLDVANEKLRHMALHDGLTNLPNRTLLEQRVKEALERTVRTGASFALMFIDLDRFKLINDSLGHQAGDDVLAEVARRVRGKLRHQDTLARLGGDEFVVLLSGIDRASDAGIVAQKIQACMAEPFRPKGAEMVISASIGISIGPQDGASVSELLAHADIAMYHAKKLGRNNCQYFAPALNEFAGRKLELENSLRKALAEEQLELWYQPKVNVASQRIVGLEALVRWRHPERGLVMPQEFIPLAEETGLITQLGTWVIRTACRQNRIWRDDGLEDVRIAVNVSAAQFRQPTLVRIITEALEESRLEPDALELEVTESVVMSNPHEAVKTLQQLREMGICISIDDFGTGYSSLSYLKKFPINTLKVDRTFIKDVLSSGDDAAIVKAIVAMARSLRLNIVAEGVEDDAQLAFLESIGCDQCQGYFFSRPVPSTAIPTLFQSDAMRSEANEIARIEPWSEVLSC